MKIVETKSIEINRNVCDWCGEAAQNTIPSIYVRSNYAEPAVLPWWKRPMRAFVGFFPVAWRENDFRYDVHVGCVEKIVSGAIEAKRESTSP